MGKARLCRLLPYFVFLSGMYSIKSPGVQPFSPDWCCRAVEILVSMKSEFRVFDHFAKCENETSYYDCNDGCMMIYRAGAEAGE